MKRANIFAVQENFKFTFKPIHYELPDEIKETIKEEWDYNKEKNPNLFNGTVVCLKEIIKNNDNYTFDFYLSDYAHFLSSHLKKIPKEYRCRNIYVSALIETADNFVSFGRMGKNSFDPGRYQFIGGGVDANFKKDNEIDFERQILNELEEELKLDIKKDIETCKAEYLAINKHDTLSLVFKIKVRMDSSQLSAQLKTYNNYLLSNDEEPEVDELIFVNKDNYTKILAEVSQNEKNHLDRNLASSLDAYFKNKMADTELIM